MTNKEKTTETILALVVALVIFGVVYKLKILLLSAIGLGLLGLFIKPVAELIHVAWMKFSELLGAITSKILLSLIFYLFISPIAFFFRLFNKNALLLKNQENSTFHERNHVFVKKDFERIW